MCYSVESWRKKIPYRCRDSNPPSLLLLLLLRKAFELKLYCNITLCYSDVGAGVRVSLDVRRINVLARTHPYHHGGSSIFKVTVILHRVCKYHEKQANKCQCERLGARLAALKRPMVAVQKGRKSADHEVLATIKELVMESQLFMQRSVVGR